jgi:hypothetical protein
MMIKHVFHMSPVFSPQPLAANMQQVTISRLLQPEVSL